MVLIFGRSADFMDSGFNGYPSNSDSIKFAPRAKNSSNTNIYAKNTRRPNKTPLPFVPTFHELATLQTVAELEVEHANTNSFNI